MKKRSFIFVMVVCCGTFIWSASHAEPFYKNKVIKLIVATKPGGGFDWYGRMAARFMQKYLPGSTIIVKNVPGAGHVIGCNEVYHAKPDGLTFGTYNQSIQLAQLVGVNGVKFDLSKMSWIGSPSFTRDGLFVSTKTSIKNLDDVRHAKEFRIACGGVGSFNYVAGLLCSRVLGLGNIKMMTGYQGGEQLMALIRGEAEATILTWSTFYPNVKAGYARPVLFIANNQPKGYEDVPLLQDLVTDQKYKPGVDLLTDSISVDRFFSGPPGIPPDRLQILRNAFQKAWNDPALLNIAKKAKRPVDVTEGAEVERVIKRNAQQPPEIIKLLKEAYGIRE